MSKLRYVAGETTEKSWAQPLPESGVLRRGRERRFVEAFVRRVLIAGAELASAPPRTRRTVMKTIAMTALGEAGYRLAKQVDVNKPAIQAEYLLGLPRVQQALALEFDKSGIGPDSCSQVMADIMHGRVTVKRQVLGAEDEVITLEDDVSAADRLRAVDLAFKLTTGYAPTKTANTNTNASVNADRYFDASTFAKAPEIDVTPKEAKKK